ncbi:Small ubiquitin-related modifier, SUMO [Metarhizium album ARSEF 1941]|uniref:Small ubiquitin-related modifier, SUMO n=1 Tax=Metarhizium album (strain ARSEF 1941) TaxID=1081103 RepID=A0A0B2WYP2_METAS|nr:Small ubiquitin-related modifier, SUMO [Metarhizium album ARSEF 1941]KHN98547.1 Small ubiquitin-related modifier, SUMO [Metarhizium album ARSEF 1941]
MSNEDGNTSPERNEAPAAGAEHLNLKVTDNNNEVFFKIKRSTKLEKLMNAFCERQGKSPASVRFLFEGSRCQPTDTPDAVRPPPFPSAPSAPAAAIAPFCRPLEMQDGDTLEVHQEQVGGAL